jgi:hypothetical protein
MAASLRLAPVGLEELDEHRTVAHRVLRERRFSTRDASRRIRPSRSENPNRHAGPRRLPLPAVSRGQRTQVTGQ